MRQARAETARDRKQRCADLAENLLPGADDGIALDELPATAGELELA